MIIYKSRFNISNVISKRYILELKYINKAIDSFMEDIKELNTIGNIFYKVDIINEEQIAIWIMIEIDSNIIPEDTSFRYDSYVGVGDSICAKVTIDELNKIKENELYNIINNFCNKEGLVIYSPSYYTFEKIDDNIYCNIFTGVY